MKSMNSLSREQAHVIIDKVYDKLVQSGDPANEVGVLFTYESYRSSYGCHSIIVLNCGDDLI